VEPRVRHALTAGVVTLLLAACGGSADDARKKPSAPKALAPTDPQRLAAEVRNLADRIADYAASHRNTPPRRLADLAVDSLTPTTARVLVVTDSPRVEVSFRRPDPNGVLACTGGPAILEQAMLHAGEFTVRCRTMRGDTLITARE
jgi:hypothetical protein